MTELINTVDMELLFNDNIIRVVGTPDNPYFIVADICKILTIGNTTDVIKMIPDKWRSSVKSKGGNSTGLQTFNTVNEAGLYKIIMRSRKKVAQKFQEFVCEEILPSIRKKGEFKMNNEYQLKINQLEEELKIKEEESVKLKKKYIKPVKQVFNDRNVVYIITSEEGENKREFCVGKATNLNNRRNNYNGNKLHNFKIIYYKSCKYVKIMDIVESMVLTKLAKYKCKAGRDVFLLPENHTIETFTNIVDECVKFYDNIEEFDIIYPKRTITDEEKLKNREYYNKNKEEILAKEKQYLIDNGEDINTVRREYYKNNADRINARHKELYNNNINRREKAIESAMEYYYDNKEFILEDRKEFYKDNKEVILKERKEYYDSNYATKISPQRQKKVKCECGMTLSHYCLKKHKLSDRHKILMATKYPNDVATEETSIVFEE